MPFYLSEYIGSGTKQDPFVPVGFDQGMIGAIDLRPDPSRLDGGGLNACLIRTSAPFTDARARFLADDKLETLTNPQKNFLQNRLGVDLSSPTLLRDIIAVLMTNPPVNGWKALKHSQLRWEIWLGELIWEVPFISGGATDDFNRADANLTTPWIDHGNGPMRVVSNRCRPENYDSDRGSIWDSANQDVADDQYAQCQVYNMTNTSADDSGIGHALRAQQTNPYDRYRIVSNAAHVWIAKDVSGYTRLADLSVTWTDGDTFRAEVEGSTLRAFKNGGSLGSTTDTSITTGQPSVMYSSFLTTGSEIDNWEAGDLTTPVAPTSVLVPPMVIGG